MLTGVTTDASIITHDVLAVLSRDGAKSVLVSSDLYHPFFGHRRDASAIKSFTWNVFSVVESERFDHLVMLKRG